MIATEIHYNLLKTTPALLLTGTCQHQLSIGGEFCVDRLNVHQFPGVWLDLV